MNRSVFLKPVTGDAEGRVEFERKGKRQSVFTSPKNMHYTQRSDEVSSLFAAGRRLLASPGDTNETLISVWGSQIEG